MNSYITYQLSKIKNTMSQQAKYNHINAIYAVLESRGFERHAIKKSIDKAIVNTMRDIISKFEEGINEE